MQTIVVCRLRTVLELGWPRKTMACPTANLLYSYSLDTALVSENRRDLVAVQSSERRLDSWKEIAAFFDRDERTVKRWEKERGLPVHRTPGGSR